MNSWKIIWDSFYKNSSRRAVATEAWRLSSIRLRVLLVLSTAAFLAFIIRYFDSSRSGLLLVGMVIYELILLYAIDQAKEAIFSGEYGKKNDGMIPPDKESYRESRYMIFRKLIKEQGITKSHIDDAMLIAESKLDLETSHGEISKKFFGFSVGVLTGLLIAIFRNFDAKETAFWASMLLLASVVAISILQAIPSRMERLKELKYFMRLFHLESD